MKVTHWNAGDAACGALIVGLKRQLDKVASGQLLHVTALSAGAPVDLPAWCRVTGHTLVDADHPKYVLRKKDH
ncbi:MAG: sulfurtransferase TusA family protein [Woeseiaceae bacterium]|nr:sulfurtransferase TusA family protein [Woeseiaceae bacterium]NIP20287.1 sulfurtransferase TusA family protein [Woeseiaceae bacterium]NIS89160.1 sulfurtransferase TusA family protein [Woeseiaceae bacterium]